jgi:hypothetical protein
VDSTTLQTATLFQQNWQIDYSAKGKQVNVNNAKCTDAHGKKTSVKGMLK